MLCALPLVASLHAGFATRPARTQRARLALVGGRIYASPSAEAIANGVVLLEDGRITAVGPKKRIKIPRDAKILDCTGLALTAGFWNNHVHFTEQKWQNAAKLPAPQLSRQLQEMLTRYGFTTVVDTASFLENTNALRARIESGEIAGPRIFTAGEPLYPREGIPYYVRDTIPPELVKLFPQPATPEEAVAVVRRQVALGADVIKLFTSSWVSRQKTLPMPAAIASAAAAEARRHGKLVLAHPSTVEGLEIALESGVDVLVHAVENTRGWNDSLIARMKSNGMALIPTLKLFEGPSRLLQQVRDYWQAGGQVLFGTDVGYLTDYDPTDEYVLLSQAGMSFRQILASLTESPAQRFGRSNATGRLAPGMEADIVVLGGDPAKDIKSFSNVRYTLRKGKVIYPSN